MERRRLQKSRKRVIHKKPGERDLFLELFEILDGSAAEVIAEITARMEIGSRALEILKDYDFMFDGGEFQTSFITMKSHPAFFNEVQDE